MLLHYIKTTFRATRKAPVYAFLNITGLALGITCAALIFLWVEDERSFDRSVAKHNQLYSVRMNLDYAGKIESYTSIPGPMPAAIKATVPGIANISRMGFGRELFGLDDKSFYENGGYVDPAYFSMLQLHFIRGNAAGFNKLHTLALSEKMAAKFFGKTDPVGKTLRVNSQQAYTITGVYSDPPPNVSLRFNWLAPVGNFLQQNRWLESWATYGIPTLLELQPGTDPARVNAQLTAMLTPKNKRYEKGFCQLWSMNDWHLYDNFTNGQQDGGQIRYVRLFSTIAWIILIIACINFMNLATARAGKRAREIGVRKTLGAVRKSLVGQFILEALLLSFTAVLLAAGLLYVTLPGFNWLVGKQLLPDLTPLHLASLAGIGAFCGLVAGSYPAFYLSSFEPAAVLKGKKAGTGTGTGFVRKGLVVLQFTVSIVLVICTVIIYQQVAHIRERDLGYNKQNLVYTDVRGNLAERFNVIRQELLRTGAIENAALSSSPPLAMWGTVTSNQLSWEGNDEGQQLKISWESVSPEYIATMGLVLKEGRNFDPVIAADSGNVIINENLARLMGKEGRVGASLLYLQRHRLRVIGIVKDFLFNNMYDGATPLMMSCDPETSANYQTLRIRLNPHITVSTALSRIEAVMKIQNPGYPFDYQFVDQEFNNLFRIETQVGQLAAVFAGLAIIISCLGLFGLAAFTAEGRTKEIGVRKVMGASVGDLVVLLSGEFVRLVALSCLIAFPLAWVMMHNWLSDYAYRTPIYWWVFGGAGLAAMIIALLTVSYQAASAALLNPVKTLRTE